MDNADVVQYIPIRLEVLRILGNYACNLTERIQKAIKGEIVRRYMFLCI